MLSLATRSASRAIGVSAARALRTPMLAQANIRSPTLSLRRFESSKTQADEVGRLRTQEQADWVAPIITYERVKELTEQPTEKVYLIDVREPEEVAQGAIPSAVSIPLSGFSQSIVLPEAEFKEKHGFNKPQKDSQVIFYCRSGKRSASASDIAQRNGYKNILNYEGSWLDWSARQGTPSS